MEPRLWHGAAAPAWSHGSGAEAPVQSSGSGWEPRLRLRAALPAELLWFGAAAPVWSRGSGLEKHFSLEQRLRSRGTGAFFSGIEPRLRLGAVRLQGRCSGAAAPVPRLRFGAAARIWSRGSDLEAHFGLEPRLRSRDSGAAAPAPRFRVGAASPVWSRSSGLEPRLRRLGSDLQPRLRLGAAAPVWSPYRLGAAAPKQRLRCFGSVTAVPVWSRRSGSEPRLRRCSSCLEPRLRLGSAAPACSRGSKPEPRLQRRTPV